MPNTLDWSTIRKEDAQQLCHESDAYNKDVKRLSYKDVNYTKYSVEYIDFPLYCKLLGRTMLRQEEWQKKIATEGAEARLLAGLDSSAKGYRGAFDRLFALSPLRPQQLVDCPFKGRLRVRYTYADGEIKARALTRLLTRLGEKPSDEEVT